MQEIYSSARFASIIIIYPPEGGSRMTLSKGQIMRIAGMELNTFNLAPLMQDLLEGASIRTAGTPVYDIDGEVLFHRIPISRGSRSGGYTDIGVNEVLGESLLAVCSGAVWNEKTLLAQAVAAAKKKVRSIKYDGARFVAYSYPKIAVQFLLRKEEVLMLELGSWAEVPKAKSADRDRFQPSNFERWSLVRELPDRTKKANLQKFRKRVALWDSEDVKKFDPSVINAVKFKKVAKLESIAVVKLFKSRKLHYSTRDVDHQVCYELRGQQTNVWCVAASTEMLLNFYRYQYDQPRLAQELGLGTCAHPNGLPYAQVAKVVTVIEKLSSNTLDATMHTNPGWAIFRDQINANRPLISFIPGHSRTVAGYIQYLIAPLGQTPFKGLLVYDPWPPTTCAVPNAGGVITTWENFATQTYQYAYSAVLKHV